MLEYLIDCTFVELGGRIFQQTIGIPMDTNCAPLLADLFLYKYEVEFLQNKSPQSRQETPRTTIQFHLQIYSWCIVSEKHKFCRVFGIHLATWTWSKGNNGDCSLSSYFDCYLYIDNGRLTTRLYDKRDDFNFPIVNFPFLSSNIPSAPAYGVYVSQLIRYARTCSNYQDFMDRGKVLTTKLLSQRYQKTKLVATLKKFCGRHHDLVNPYNVTVSRIVSDVFANDEP